MTILLTIVLFVLILGLLILVHEFGHFVAARIVGITVEEFSIGMGPSLWSKVKGDVKYSIRALPIGGYLKMLGEDDMDLQVGGSFGSKSPWQRLFVIIAGVLMNFLMVIVVGYIVGAMSSFEYAFPSQDGAPLLGNSVERVAITYVAEGSPAEEVGLTNGDLILSIDGEEKVLTDDFIEYVDTHRGEEITLELVKLADSGEVFYKTVTPRVDPPEGEGAIGIGLGNLYIVKFEGWGTAGSGPAYALNLVSYVGRGFTRTIGDAFEQKTVGPVADQATGPVGLFYFIQLAIEAGVPAAGIIEFFGIVGISLVLINLLPIPGLDGGYVVFLLIEGISGKRLPGKVLRWITLGGMSLLILLVIAIMVKDILALPSVKSGLCNAFGWFC